MSAGAGLCRELWAMIEKHPALRVDSVVMSSVHFRWTCIVSVPWDRWGHEISTHAELTAMVEKLRAYEAKLIEEAKPVPVEAHVSGEVQLGLFA